MSDSPAVTPTKYSFKHDRRAFWLNVTNGMFFTFSSTLMDPTLVLVLFVSQLTASNFLIGAVSTIGSAGWFLPQLFISGWIQSQPRQLPIYKNVARIRVLSWLLLVAAIWLVQDTTLLLIAFYVTYVIMNLMAGLAGIPFMEVMAKTISPERRGRLFGLRMFLGGLFGLLGSRVVKWALQSSIPYPRNYALLIFIALLIGLFGLVIFSLTHEPEGPTRKAASLTEQFQRGGQALRANHNYRYLLVGRSFLFLGFIAIPFYTVLARQVLGAPDEVVGDYLALTTLTALLGNYPWGWLLDRKGMRWGLRIASLSWVLTTFLGLAIWWAAQSGWLAELPFPAYFIAYPLFFLRGLFAPVGHVAGLNLLLEIAPTDDRSLYLGFSNTLLGGVLLFSTLGGALMDLLGIQVLFLLTIVVNLVACYFFGRIGAAGD
ncbi:MAG: MFS transporter [Chloroflexota bacterium]|nr:MFS transporter [Chloroflexota bacterium]